jgi:hypothetical protein
LGLTGGNYQPNWEDVEMKGKQALTGPERMQEVRKRKEEAGYRQINVWLSPEADLALSETRKRLESKGKKLNQSEVICEALMRRDS